MKRTFSIVLLLIIIFSVAAPASAVENGECVFYRETDIGDGVVLVDEIVVYEHARATTKTATRTRTIKDDGVIIGVIAMKAIFRYDGSTVSVASKSITQTDTYEGWGYKQNSFTSSGGTVTLDVKLTKLIFLNIPFTMTLSCDEDGNISY